MKHSIVSNQHVKVVQTSEDFSKWSEKHGQNPLSDPDSVEFNEANTLYGTGKKPELAELIIERFTDDNGNFPILSKQQNLILKMYLQGLSIKGIAVELDLRKQSVKTHLNRASKKLKKLCKSLDF